jgi:UTP:GlnB (protein PII) uridylyltransferase
VSTLGAEVVDAFYVAESDGAAVVSPVRRAEVEAALLTVCPRPE